MSCLSVKISPSPLELKGLLVTRVPSRLHVGVDLVDAIKVSCSFYGTSICGCCTMLNAPLVISAEDIMEKQHLSVSLGIVCGVTEVNYLRVSPSEIQWITPDSDIVYSVESNTDWNIETF